MKAKEVFGSFGCRPGIGELHADWFHVSLHARLIGMELIAQCKDPGDLRIPTGADWRTSLCAKMCVNGPDRRNAKDALDKLVKAGFLHPETGFARITLAPVLSQSGSTSDPLTTHSGSSTDPVLIQKQPNAAISHQSAALDSEQVKIRERGASEDLREPNEPSQVVLFQPAGSDDPKSKSRAKAHPLADFICNDHHDRYLKRLSSSPSGAFRAKDARLVAKWVEENAGRYRVTQKALATKLLDGFFADAKAAVGGFKLSWVANDPQQYCGYPPGVANPRHAFKTTAKSTGPVDFDPNAPNPWRRLDAPPKAVGGK